MPLGDRERHGSEHRHVSCQTAPHLGRPHRGHHHHHRLLHPPRPPHIPRPPHTPHRPGRRRQIRSLAAAWRTFGR